MSDKKEAQVLHESSIDISGDDSVAYRDWSKYVEAVDSGSEVAPREVNVKKRPDYEFNVDKALDSIDLTFNGYVPSADALEFFNMMRLVMGEDPEVGNGLMHYFLVDLVLGNIKRENYPYSEDIRDKIRINKKKIAIIASRMSAKSTVITAFLPIYLAITGKMPNFGKVMFVVGFGDSQQAGAKVQANTIRDICEDSQFCKEYFEKMRFTDEECEFIRRGDEKLKDRAFMYKVKGAAGGSVRGIRYKTERPQLFIFDDIIKSEADANSPVIMAKLRSMIYADAENALGRKGMVIIVNTPFNKSDPVYSALESGIWTPVCLPICEKINLNLRPEDYVASWPEMHEYERTMERYEDAHYGGTLREFNQELMLRISNDEDRMVQEDMIQWYDRVNILKNSYEYEWYVTTDFTSTGSKGSDYSGIALWAMNSNKDMFLVDLVLRKQELDVQYDEVFNIMREYLPRTRGISAGVEIDGQQNTHILALKDRMVKHNIFFTMARQKGAKVGQEGIRSRLEKGGKHWRFRLMLPYFQNKKIWFPNELKNTPDMSEMLDEIKYCTYTAIGSKHDDGLDLLSQVGLMEIVYPVAGVNYGKDMMPGTNKKYKGIWGNRGNEEPEYNMYDSYS